MTHLLISPAAKEDIKGVLRWSEKHFGKSAKIRYKALLNQAFKDLVADPNRAGILSRREIGPDFKTYHISYSRMNLPTSLGRVNSPRHLLLFRFRDQETIEICRVLHDNMDIARHLPED